MLSGNFRSIFKGQGMEFDEARHYQWGDDARVIDWNASARLGTPFVKMFREERDVAIVLHAECAAAMQHGTGNLWGNNQNLCPYEQALIAAALIAFSAERSGQRVGAFIFDREIDRVFPPRKGRRNVLAFVSGALQRHKQQFQRQKPAAANVATATNVTALTSNLSSAIAGAGRMLKRRRMVVLLSDFLSVGWEHELNDLSSKHDVIAVRVSDPEESSLPDFGLITIADPETGIQLEAQTSSVSFRNLWLQWHRDRAELWSNFCRRAGAAHLEIPVGADAAAALTRFFSGRGGH
jgi:uncharacterized protein (DUF58 family)